MNKANLNIPHEKIAEFCKANRIRRLALFGSVLREDFSLSIIAVESPVKVEQQENKGAF
jgi:predicted nucleotidyltransferase